MDASKVLETLKKCELFSRLSEKEIESIGRSAMIEKFNAGEIVYEQGSVGDNLYILAEGQVSLERSVSIGRMGKANVTVFVQRETPSRRLMGSWSSLVGERHIQMCTAKCDQPTTLIRIPSSAFADLIASLPEVRIKILEKVVIMLRERIVSSYEVLETL